MTTEEVCDLIENLRTFDTDLQHTEVKRAAGGFPGRLWETLSAFANTPGGGVLILGVDEASDFEPVGAKHPKKFSQDLASLCDQMQPPIRALIDLHRVDDGTLVVAEVPEAGLDQKPCYYPGAGLTNGAFIRVADGDRRLSQYEVHLMLASQGQPQEDAEPVPEASRQDLHEDLVQELVARLREERRSFADHTDEELLRTIKVLVRHEGDWVPSLGGLLALGEYPQHFLAELGVTFVAYPTPRVGEPGPQGERFVDERRFEGPIPLILEPALQALQRNMKRRATVHGLGRENQWEYPITALREALVNALVHRDLSALSRGTPVQVQMFPDRLVITNPGGLHGPVTVDRLGEEGLSSSRNSVLMKILEDTAVPGSRHGVCENRGSGIGAMLAALREAGMSPPDFNDRIANFRVTFPNHTLLDNETLTWLQSVGAEDLTDSQRMALALLRKGGEITNSVYRKTSRVDSRVATRELRDLVDRGLVEQINTGRWAKYQLVREQISLLIDRGEAVTQQSDRAGDILRLLEQQGPLGRAEIAERLEIADSTAGYWLKKLREARKIEITTTSPRDPNVKYRIAVAEPDGRA